MTSPLKSDLFTDKPISLSVKDYLIRKLAVKMMTSEKTIEAVVNHQFQSAQQAAVNILRRAEDLKTTAGKDPMGLAAAALYIACVMNDEKRTQKMIADAAGVTEVTIRNRYKGLKEALNMEI